MNEKRGDVAAVFRVGQTAGGCEFALRWILKERQERPELFFFYGQAERGQAIAPLSAVHALLAHPEFADLPRGGEQATNAFSLDRAYVDALELVRKMEARGYRRVYVGITGASNPMVAALFHAAMHELTGEVIPVYVQAKPTPGGQQNSIELIPGVRTREAIQMERALALCRRGQLTAAKGVAEDLPARGRGGFVRRAVLALGRWDNFEYGAVADIQDLAERSDDFVEDRLLQSLADTIRRYAKIGRHLSEMEAILASPEQFAKARLRPSWPDEVHHRASWLPMDALANSRRRLEEGHATDAVMRAYRAVEIAVHCRLFGAGVHPSALEWGDAPLRDLAEGWRAQMGTLPDVVAFEQALQLLSIVIDEDFSDTEAPRRDLQNCRNNSYLEHGYQRVAVTAGRRIIEKAHLLVERILWREGTADRLEHLRMIF